MSAAQRETRWAYIHARGSVTPDELIGYLGHAPEGDHWFQCHACGKPADFVVFGESDQFDMGTDDASDECLEILNALREIFEPDEGNFFLACCNLHTGEIPN